MGSYTLTPATTVSGVTTLPASGSFAVSAGVASAATSTVTRSPVSITADGAATSTLTVQLQDVHGNNLASSGGTVTFVAPTLGSIGVVTDNTNGTYTATYTAGMVTGVETITPKLDGTDFTNSTTVTLTPGPVSVAHSTVEVTSATVVSGDSVTITLRAKDAAGNSLTTGGSTVVFSLAGDGSAGGTFGAVVDHGDGTYTVVFTATTAGTPNTVNATIDGNAVTWGPLPTIEVTP